MNCIAIHLSLRRCNGRICYHFRQPKLLTNLVVTTPMALVKNLRFLTSLRSLNAVSLDYHALTFVKARNDTQD
ncbi:MAG: hypothetical protein IJV35_03610 [Neisseriaceae bacterium]|nr:hypothetical protein [Neisseriaceae bacterium]